MSNPDSLSEEARLRQLNQLKDAFLAAVSHDLRTPIASILGFIDVLLSEESVRSRPDCLHAAERIAANARKISRLVTDLLEFDHATSGDMPSRRMPTDVAAVANEMVAGLALDRPVDVAGDSLVFPVDRVQYERIVENLVLNADRYAPPGSAIQVMVEHSPDDGLVLSVEDEGPGVPDEEKEAIFEPFRRGVQRASGGSGIGLGVVAAFARLHGGRAWVEDRAGGGSRFCVTFAPAGADSDG